MGYLCNAESAIATCDSYNWDKAKLTNKKKKKSKHPIKLRHFSYADLEAATNAFSPRCLLGKGSHGAVFRAVLDGGTLTAAVKRTTLAVTGTSENEIEILSKIQSRRIVNLIGYAVDSGERKLLLVVEYMPKGALYEVIHKHKKPPGWSIRVRYALQVAKAVQALHGSNPPVIHRDIKSSNVLIDGRGNARLSDFGLALRGHVEDVRVLSTPPAGTLGYLDPCYLAPGDLSTKSDVFSFGILLLEIMSGRCAIDVNYSPPSILDWALPLIKSGTYHRVCDRRIGCPTDPAVSRDLAVLAARCARSTAGKRPAMEEVVDCLKMIYKRVKLQAVPIFNNLRRRVRQVEGSWTLDDSDGDQERVRTSRHGSRRSLSSRSRKVSNVPSTECTIEEVTRVSNRVIRSKSIGSFREIKEGSEMNGVGVRKRAQVSVTVKMGTVVRLSKSRSMSVLLHHGHGKNPQIKEVDVFPLLLHSSAKAEALK